MRRRDTLQAGFTLMEVMVVIVIAALGLTAAVQLYRGGNELSEAQRERAHLAAQQRVGHARIAHVLRTASVATLDGFDGSGVATAPRLQPVEGMDTGGVVLGTPVEIRWVPRGAPVPGISNPGDVYLLPDTGTPSILASNVMENGFEVRRGAVDLVVSLTTFRPARGADDALTLTTESAVALRND